MPARLLSEDLWFDPGAPLKTRYHAALLRNETAVLVAMSVLASLAAGMVTAWLMFPAWRSPKGMLKAGGLGLSNCLTILGLVWAVSTFLDPNRQREVAAARGAAAKLLAIFSLRRAPSLSLMPFIFIPAFSILFLLFLQALALALGVWP